MTLTLTNSSGSFDITKLVSTVQWSGSCTQCARTLSFGLLADGAPDCSLGCHVSMSDNGASLFTGIVLTRTRSTASQVIDLTAFDYGIYLKQNQTSMKCVQMTPEAAAAAVCGEFGIPMGRLAAAGVPVSRKFFGKSLYEIIITMYTEAAKQTGKKYFVRFSGTSLNVLEKGAAGRILVVKGGSNLIDASTTEDAQRLVNRAAVYDQNENLLSVMEDAASEALYGVMQKVVKQKQGEDANAAAADLLKGSGPEQRITVNCLGDASCTSGGSVMMQESTTGLCGRFFIDSDVHQWKNGIYTNKLVLNLNAVMDEKSAGEELAASGGSSGSAQSGAGEYQKYLDNLHSRASGEGG